MTRIVVSGLVFASLFVAGCFNSQEIVQQRAANEFRCPAAQVQVEELGGNAYRVWACGNGATYACSARMGMCLKEPGATSSPQPAMPPVAAPPTTPFGTPAAPPEPTAPMPMPPAPAPTSTSPWGTP